MDSIIFLIAVVAVIYVLIWSIRNEDAEDDEPTQGLFGMIPEDDKSEQGVNTATSGEPDRE